MQENNLIIKAVGDICPGDKSILGLGVCSLMKKYGPDFMLNHVQGLFKDADIVIGNLEGVLSKNAYLKKETFSGIPEFVVALKKIGFNVLNVANNHIMEKGVAGFNETVDAVHAAGIEICGTRSSDVYYSKPVIINKKGMTVGILAYNWVSVDLFPLADECIAQSHDSVVNYTWHRDPQKDRENQSKVHERNLNVLQDIRILKKNVDSIIFIPHWGYEFVPYPPFGVTLEAKSFIDAGADLIIGIHPHVLQGIEYYKNRCIMYSLGNFIFDSRSSLTRKTVIFKADISKAGSCRDSFIFISANNRFQPIPCKEPELSKNQFFLKSLSSYFNNGHLEAILNDDRVYRQFEQKYTLLKWQNIVLHFTLMFRHPTIILIILKKIGTLMWLIFQRMRGNKIRW